MRCSGEFRIESRTGTGIQCSKGILNSLDSDFQQSDDILKNHQIPNPASFLSMDSKIKI